MNRIDTRLTSPSDPDAARGSRGGGSAEPQTVITLDRIRKRFGSSTHQHTAVHEINQEFSGDTRVGIVGESGSGKSTLARMIVGLETPSSGRILFGTREVSEMLGTRSGRATYRRAVQFIGQDTTSSFDPRHRLIEAVIKPSMRLRGLNRTEATGDAEKTLEGLGLSQGLGDRYPSEVSGGQRQRFAIARALVVRPQFLVCDEVVSALDVSIQGTILNLIKEYCEDSRAGLIFVSHGLPATAFVAKSLMVMYQGVVVESGLTDDVIERPQHPYTRRLLSAYLGHEVTRDEP